MVRFRCRPQRHAEPALITVDKEPLLWNGPDKAAML